MGYLIAQMIVSLTIALAIGFIAGWWLRRELARKETQSLLGQLSEARRAREQREEALTGVRNVFTEPERRLRVSQETDASVASDRTAAGNELHAKILHLERVVSERDASAEQIADWQGRYHSLEAKYVDAESQVDALKTELERLRRQSAVAHSAPALAAGATAGRTAAQRADDLKRIYGIGPVFERMLNDMGIHRFEQVANLTAPDLDRIAARLETFPYRIKRDRWVEQARELSGRA